jgi:Zn2+/Cd2+-exporting ATPase
VTRTVAATTCAVCEVHAESVFKIDGMDCHEEVAILERRLKHLAGLEALAADVMGGRLVVKYDAARLSTSAITEAVADTGMRAWLEHEQPQVVGTSSSRLTLVRISGAALAGGLALTWWGAPQPLAIVLFLAAIATGGVYPGRRALTAVRLRSLDINVLMAVAVTGAMAIGEWAEAGTVVFLFALAQYLEARSMDRARNAIRALMDLTPLEARRIQEGVETRVSVDDVAVGDVLRIRPGEKVPLDGTVAAGASDVNQAPITGESLPIDKHPGDDVFAGSINGHGALDMRVTRLRRDTTLARIIHLVEEAQARRAPTQAFVDRFARYYTPAVIALAVLIAVVPWAAFGQPFTEWLYRALVLLVIACPCALVISTPVSVVSALAAAARRGVLVKGGLHLERMAAIRCLAFDKTGTLTRGEPAVLEVEPLGGATPEQVLAVAAAVEAHSEHPIAQAIVAAARQAGAPRLRAEQFRARPGRGGEARVDGRSALVGNLRLFHDAGVAVTEVEPRIRSLSGAGRTAVLVWHDGVMLGTIALADRAREAAADVVELLRRQRFEHIVMLTGDNEGAARAVATSLGLEEVHAGLLPEDKLAVVEALKRQYGSVAMVGDGVNDAPALAAADVGIAMGAAGTDAALETADVALMGDELSKIPYLVRLSRSTLANIKTNIAIALLLKAVFLILAVTGHATLWMAIVADTGASLLVIGNGLRLLRTT